MWPTTANPPWSWWPRTTIAWRFWTIRCPGWTAWKCSSERGGATRIARYFSHRLCKSEHRISGDPCGHRARAGKTPFPSRTDPGRRGAHRTRKLPNVHTGRPAELGSDGGWSLRSHAGQLSTRICLVGQRVGICVSFRLLRKNPVSLQHKPRRSCSLFHSFAILGNTGSSPIVLFYAKH